MIPNNTPSNTRSDLACTDCMGQDLASLGVPYLSVDVAGNVQLWRPNLEIKSLEDEGKTVQQVGVGG